MSSHKQFNGFRRWLQGAALLAVFVTPGVRTSAQTNSPDQPAQAQQPAQSGQLDDAAQPNAPSLFTPLKPQIQDADYHPITPRQRLRWFITNTVGPSHLAGGVFTSAFGTALDRPQEYGTNWRGFADRYGMRMTGIVTGNAMEASIGFLAHEDPRYFRVPDRPFKARVANVIRLTFMARHDDGSFGPAYARFTAISGSNFLSNSWRVQSEANTHDAILRTGEGFAGRMAANAFEEFWPDVKQHLFHRHVTEN